MNEANPKLHLEVDPQHLSRIIDSAVVTSSELVNFHFNHLAKADLSKPSEPAEQPGISIRFKGPELSADQRRAAHENWMLAKAFQDLLRAVRHALEEAYVLTQLLTKKHTVRSDSTLEDFLKPLRAKAAGLSFPELLAVVNKKLEPKLDFADSYISLQKVRNCLEHRAGLVTNVETRGTDVFEFSVPRVKIFYMRNGEEVELKKGEVVDPGDDQEQVVIEMKLEKKTRSIKLGERLTFDVTDFNEISFACHQLGAQLAGKLPKVKIGSAQAANE